MSICRAEKSFRSYRRRVERYNKVVALNALRVSPKSIALKVPCSLSYVYNVINARAAEPVSIVRKPLFNKVLRMLSKNNPDEIAGKLGVSKKKIKDIIDYILIYFSNDFSL